jgi:hypothetical protein
MQDSRGRLAVRLNRTKHGNAASNIAIGVIATLRVAFAFFIARAKRVDTRNTPRTRKALSKKPSQKLLESMIVLPDFILLRLIELQHPNEAASGSDGNGLIATLGRLGVLSVYRRVHRALHSP